MIVPFHFGVLFRFKKPLGFRHILVGCFSQHLPRSNKSNFDQWFNDVPGVNRRVPGSWLLVVAGL